MGISNAWNGGDHWLGKSGRNSPGIRKPTTSASPAQAQIQFSYDDYHVIYGEAIADIPELERIATTAAAIPYGSHSTLKLTHPQLPLTTLIPDATTAQRFAQIIEKKFTNGVVFTSPVPDRDPIEVSLNELRDGSIVDRLRIIAPANSLNKKGLKTLSHFGFNAWPDQSLHQTYEFNPKPKNTDELIATLCHVPNDQTSILLLPMSQDYTLTDQQKSSLLAMMIDRKIKYIISLKNTTLYHTDQKINGYIASSNRKSI